MVHLPKQYMYLEDCDQWVSSCWKSTTLFLFLMHLYPSTSDAEPGKAYRWRGAPVPCVCWYMYLQTSSQENIVSRPHTLPMSVWYNFHWHHLLRNRCMEPSVVAMQKIVPFCCDLYPMHHVCTCGLATGVTQCVGPNSWWQFLCNIPSILIQSSTSNSHEPSIPLCICHAPGNSPNLPPILNWLPLT